jgi:hypothetical protein
LKNGVWTAALVLREDVHLCLEVRVRRDRAGLREHLAALDVLALDPAQERAGVVARLREVERLLEHLEPGDDRLLVSGWIPTISTSLPVSILPCSMRPVTTVPAPGDREDVLDRHQERLVDVPLRLRDVLVDGAHELEDLRHPLAVALERLQRGHLHDRDVVARELVPREQLAHLHLDELEQLGIVDHVGLVQRDDHRRHLDLPASRMCSRVCGIGPSAA